MVNGWLNFILFSIPSRATAQLWGLLWSSLLGEAAQATEMYLLMTNSAGSITGKGRGAIRNVTRHPNHFSPRGGNCSRLRCHYDQFRNVLHEMLFVGFKRNLLHTKWMRRVQRHLWWLSVVFAVPFVSKFEHLHMTKTRPAWLWLPPNLCTLLNFTRSSVQHRILQRRYVGICTSSKLPSEKFVILQNIVR